MADLLTFSWSQDPGYFKVWQTAHLASALDWPSPNELLLFVLCLTCEPTRLPPSKPIADGAILSPESLRRTGSSDEGAPWHKPSRDADPVSFLPWQFGLLGSSVTFDRLWANPTLPVWCLGLAVMSPPLCHGQSGLWRALSASLAEPSEPVQPLLQPRRKPLFPVPEQMVSLASWVGME